MNPKYLALAAAASAAFAIAPSFAQTAVQSGTAATVGSGTGVTVTSPNDATVTVTPHTASAVPTARLMPGGTMQAHGSTTTLGGPGASNTKTVLTRYWVNVPADAQQRLDFRRWQRLAD